MTIHESVMDYFTEIIHEIASRYPTFNFANDSVNSIGIIPSYSSSKLAEYINGDCQREYTVAIIVSQNYSIGNDTVNLDAMGMCQSIMERIDKNEETKEYPLFPEGYKVELIENLQNMPATQAVTDSDTARYMIQVRIVYKEYANGY